MTVASRLQLEPKLLLISCASVIFCLIVSVVVQSLSSVSQPLKKKKNHHVSKASLSCQIFTEKKDLFPFQDCGESTPNSATKLPWQLRCWLQCRWHLPLQHALSEDSHKYWDPANRNKRQDFLRQGLLPCSSLFSQHFIKSPMSTR